MRLELTGGKGALKVTPTGSETLVSAFGVPILEKISKRYPRASFELRIAEGVAAVKELEVESRFFKAIFGLSL